jgi:hypothetical protein
LLKRLAVAAALAAVTCAPAAQARIEIGLASQPGTAHSLSTHGRFAYRYQYLAGGVNTGAGWSTWNPNGSYVTRYIGESARAHITPVFTYYMIRQSRPGRDDRDEPRAVIDNLRNAATMRAYWADLRLFFRRAAATRRRVVLHVEPDMWGYLESEGQVRLARSIAQRVVRMRNRLARNVRLGYHLSVWGTRTDIAIQDPKPAEVDRLAARAAGFYRALHAHFDMLFGEFSDRDSGFKQRVSGVSQRDAWWTRADFARHVRFLAGVHRRVRLPIFLWQIPLGNSGLPDTWGRFRDNRPQWLLGKGSRGHRAAYARAGVRALLFGAGADGCTTEKTDGGWFFRHVRGL